MVNNFKLYSASQWFFSYFNFHYIFHQLNCVLALLTLDRPWQSIALPCFTTFWPSAAWKNFLPELFLNLCSQFNNSPLTVSVFYVNAKRQMLTEKNSISLFVPIAGCLRVSLKYIYHQALVGFNWIGFNWICPNRTEKNTHSMLLFFFTFYTN